MRGLQTPLGEAQIAVGKRGSWEAGKKESRPVEHFPLVTRPHSLRRASRIVFPYAND